MSTTGWIVIAVIVALTLTLRFFAVKPDAGRQR